MTLQAQLGQRQHGGLVPVLQLPVLCLYIQSCEVGENVSRGHTTC